MKKTLAILLALVLCLSAFALIACNECEHNYVDGVCTKCGDKDPNYKPDGPQGGGEDVEVPVADGKITLYFTLADESVAIPSYASFYFTGEQLAWATGADSIEFKRMGETKVYYVQIAYDATIEKAGEYAIVLGYNASSGLPTDKLGLKWVDGLKSDECSAYAYPDNAKFVVADGATRINLGKHTFSTEIAEPIRINTTLAVTFEPALPEKAEVYIIGTVNEWNTSDLTKSKATADATRNVYTLAVKDVLCSTHYYKILVFLNGTENVIKTNAKGEALSIWDWQVDTSSDVDAQADEEEAPVDYKYIAYIEISAGEDNLPVDIFKYHNNSTVDLAGTVSETEYDKDGVTPVKERTGIDLVSDNAKLTEVEGKKDKLDAAGKPVLDADGNAVKEPNGIITAKYIVVANKTLTVTFKTAVPDTANVYVIGSFLDSGWKTTIGQARMTLSEDRKTATVTYKVLPGEYKFHVLVIHKEIEIGADDSSVVQPIWDFGTKLCPNDATVNITGFADGEVKLFAEEQEVPEVKPPVKVASLVLRVKFDQAPEGKHVFVAGSFNGWTGVEMTADATDAKVYTVTLTDVIVKSYEFLVTLSDTDKMDWDTKYGANGVLGGGNATVEVKKDDTTIDLYGETVLKTGKEYAESVTFTVTFSEAITGHVFLVGDMNGWAFQEMAKGEGNTYTITVANVEVKTHGYKVVISPNADSSWSDTARQELGGNAPNYGGADNATVVIEATTTTSVTLFKDLTLVAPAA